MTDNEDKILLESFADEAQKEIAFKKLVEKYQKRLYWHIRKIIISHDDTNDVLQNVFIKVWKNLANFRGDSEFFTWLYRIATNEALTFLKQKRTRFFLPLGDVENQLEKTLKSDPYFNGDEAQLKFQTAILKLPEKQRIVFNMKYYDDLKYEEMSEILETSVGALKASYHHAVKKIEIMLKNN